MQVDHDVDLMPLNTFGLSVKAKHFCTLLDKEQLNDIVRLTEYQLDSVLWLGGGSNIIFGEDYPGLVVRVANRGITHFDTSTDAVLVEAAAGEVWHDFVQYTLAQGWSGLENLSLIPGTVGAAPVQNIGAYGVEVQSCIESVLCFDLYSNTYVRLNRDACHFAYRDSIFKHKNYGQYVIVAVRFVLSRQFKPQLKYGGVAQVCDMLAAGKPLTATLVSQAICHIRQRKLPDPKCLGSVGSFFKNPIVSQAQATALLAEFPHLPCYPQSDGQVKLAAGWLIDQCGLKGFQLGGAAVHHQQALVLVNKNHASPMDVALLAKHIQHEVALRFRVSLLPEPVCFPASLLTND